MSDAPPLGLFDGVLARGRAREATSDQAWLDAMLDFEVALARASARAGLFPAADAEAIATARRAARFDIPALARAAADIGNPAEPLVRALTSAVPGKAAGHVHRGATSQDVVDTAAMLVAHRALAPLLEDLRASADAAAGLAAAHRATLMAGRTLLQQALPITFGLKAAGWLAGLDDATARLEDVRRSRLAVQLGGAAGTLASLGSSGPEVLAYLAEELGLPAPMVPWHTARARVAELGSALGGAAGAIGKPARDVTLLAQTEIAEVREKGPSRGGSSTLPHKHNPIAAVSAVACAERAPGLVSTLLGSMIQEHERAAGAWHAEWRPFTDLIVTVGSAAAWLCESLAHLEVDERRMRQNLDLTGGLLLAERVTTALAPAMGRVKAHDLMMAVVNAARASGRSFAEELGAEPEVRPHLSTQQIAALLDPAGYLGSAELFVERALQAHTDRRRGPA
jgi:3-carboxy-cis,cis-muconate cycloisomerase